ncbi:MAG: methyltransferase [Herpetosiphonaceae bacterium]|nr:methyltransferase [Herpetosiphonaceae bacterium]
MEGWTADVYFKKRIKYTLNRHPFQFDVAELLFSSHDIDIGTQFLIRQMINLEPTPTTILDLGCGYGVIGIVLARLYQEADVVLSDKDLLAVAYTQHNLELNRIANGRVYGSISIDDLPARQYDLIVSNVPGHIGDLAIEEDFILKPLTQLLPGGSYMFVVVHPLKALVESVAQRHDLLLTLLGDRGGHAVYSIMRAEVSP